jgi:hypothetical protein
MITSMRFKGTCLRFLLAFNDFRIGQCKIAQALAPFPAQTSAYQYQPESGAEMFVEFQNAYPTYKINHSQIKLMVSSTGLQSVQYEVRACATGF